jgi:hypothetical protein
MTEEQLTKTAEIREREPHGDVELLLFEAPFDGFIANVAFTHTVRRPKDPIRTALSPVSEIKETRARSRSS